MFWRWTKVLRVWNDMKVSKWQNFHFWVNYPFKHDLFRQLAGAAGARSKSKGKESKRKNRDFQKSGIVGARYISTKIPATLFRFLMCACDNPVLPRGLVKNACRSICSVIVNYCHAINIKMRVPLCQHNKTRLTGWMPSAISPEPMCVRWTKFVGSPIMLRSILLRFFFCEHRGLN